MENIKRLINLSWENNSLLADN